MANPNNLRVWGKYINEVGEAVNKGQIPITVAAFQQHLQDCLAILPEHVQCEVGRMRFPEPIGWVEAPGFDPNQLQGRLSCLFIRTRGPLAVELILTATMH